VPAPPGNQYHPNGGLPTAAQILILIGTKAYQTIDAMREDAKILSDAIVVMIQTPSLIGLFGGLFVFSKQLVSRVKLGHWDPPSGIDLISTFSDVTSLYRSSDWVSAYQVLEWFHVGLLLALLGSGITLMLIWMLVPTAQLKNDVSGRFAYRPNQSRNAPVADSPAQLFRAFIGSRLPESAVRQGFSYHIEKKQKIC
jgi:hypothetical protein